MDKKDVEKFVSYCKEHLNFEIESPAGYRSAPLSALDAIFSLGIRYKAVENALKRFCDKFELKWQTSDIKTSVMLSRINSVIRNEKLSIEEFADLYLNNNKTSTSKKPGVAILKAQAFVKALEVMKKNSIETCADVLAKVDDSTFETDFLSINGQGPGTSLHYLYMLCGNEDFIKVDRHIKNFTCQALNKESLDHDTIFALFKNAVTILKTDNNDITPKRLDHIIWKFMSNKKKQVVTNKEKVDIKTNKSKNQRKRTTKNHPRNGSDKVVDEEKINLNGIEFTLFVGQRYKTDRFYCEIKYWGKEDVDINTLSDAQLIFKEFAIPNHSWISKNPHYKYLEYKDNDGKMNLRNAKELKNKISAFIHKQ